jgi:hypothetical protein
MNQLRDVVATLNDSTGNNQRNVEENSSEHTRDPSKAYLDDMERLDDCHDGYQKQYHKAKKAQKKNNKKNKKNKKNKNHNKVQDVHYHTGFKGPKGPKPLNNPHKSPLYNKNCKGGKCPKEYYNPLEDPQNIYFAWHHRPSTALGMAYIPSDEPAFSSITPNPVGGFDQQGNSFAYAAPTPVGGF